MQSDKKLIPIKDLLLGAGLPGLLLFFRNILLFFVTRKRDLENYSSVDDSALIQISFLIVVFCVTCYLLYQDPKIARFIYSKPQIFLFIYIVICFISMLWTPNIFITGYRAFESLTYLLLISLVTYNLVSRLNIQNIIEWSMLWIIWEIFWTVATKTKLAGLDYILLPFGASRLTVPMFFFFALLLVQRSYFKYIVFIFAVFAVSNKIYFGITFGLLGFFFGNSKYKTLLLFAITSILVMMLFVTPEQLLKETLFYGRESVSITNTSGRDKIWTIAWEAFLQKPFFGYGFVEGETAILYSKFRGAISTHNFFFSGLLGTGILGTVFLLLYFWSTFKVASSTYFPINKWRPAMVSTFIMSLIISLTAPGIGGRVYGSWIPVVLIISLISGLQFKFKIISKIQNIKNYENNLDHSFFS